MYIIKANGTREVRDITKIQKQTMAAVKGLTGVSQSGLEVDVSRYVVDGTSSKAIQQHLIKCAVDKIDIDAPNWTYVAARLFMYDMYKRIYKLGIYYDLGISNWFRIAKEHDKCYNGITDGYDMVAINEAIDPEYDMTFTYLGIKTLYDKYSIKIGDEYAELPQYLFMGIAMFLHSNETENKTEKAIAHYNRLRDYELMHGTPTLSNARTPRHQLSSCFIGSTHDSIEGLTGADTDIAMISKFGGGIGWDWSSVRASLSKIDDHSKVAGGYIPFLKVVNDLSIAYDQLGVRKGAVAPYSEPWHMDIMDFIDLKKNSGEERRRTHDIYPALWITDMFMEAVDTDSDWYLFDPYEVDLTEVHGDEFREKYLAYTLDESIRKEKISAKGLWKEILRSYVETGMPFLGFKDTANYRNPNRHAGMIRSSNLCVEIFQNTSPGKIKQNIELESGELVVVNEETPVETDKGFKAGKRITSLDTIAGEKVLFNSKELVGKEIAVCNLASINLAKMVNFTDLEEPIRAVVRALDNVVDLNLYPTKDAMRTGLSTRSIGVGAMGEAELIANRQIHWGSDEHLELINSIYEHISYYTIEASIDLAIEKGTYPLYEGSDWSKGIFPHETFKGHEDLPTYSLSLDWERLREKMIKNGVRNGYMLAIAPTSSISILCGTTQGIEPIYKLKFFEDNLSGLIPVVAPNLNVNNIQFYTKAYELNQLVLIKAAAVRQRWLDQGQSLNIFIKADQITGQYLNKIYMSAWKYGLKSTYYLRSESPEVTTDVMDRSTECVMCQ